MQEQENQKRQLCEELEQLKTPQDSREASCQTPATEDEVGELLYHSQRTGKVFPLSDSFSELVACLVFLGIICSACCLVGFFFSQFKCVSIYDFQLPTLIISQGLL